jgi:hypothetical protein
MVQELFGQLPLGGEMPGVMGVAGELPATTPTVSPISSPLDMWSFRKYGVMADQLSGDEFDEFLNHILENADSDVEFWEERDRRFMDSQKYWEIGSRYGQNEDKLGHNITITENEQPQPNSAEIMELNDGYLIVDKIASMVAGAAWGVDVPPKEPRMDDIAQDIEDFLRWLERELDAKHTIGLNSTLLRDEVHYAALRGWITGIVTPDPENPRLPIKYTLEDPLFVYPRYSGDKLVRVIHRYSINALEAQSSFPSAFEFLLDYDEDEDLEVTEYYDNVYRVSILSDGRVSKNTSTQGRGLQVVQPLVRHGYMDINGQPINPWIIVAPRGAPSRRFGDPNNKGDRKKAAGMIGLDVLHPVKHIIDHLEKLASIQMTEVAKGVNPPRVVYYDGVNPPAALDLGIGAENYLVMGTQQVELLNTTSMKPDAGPLLTLLNDRLQKGSVPAVLYGQNSFALAGYAINLLSQGAQDVVRPILDGVKAYRELRFRRMLEMYVNIGAAFAGPMTFASQDPTSEQMYTGAKSIDPEAIRANGVYVEVTYDTIMPRDTATLLAAGISGNQAGVIPLYDAMKNYAGIKDPRQALQRLAEGLNYQDPMVQKWLARIAGSKSGNTLLVQAIQAAQYEEEQMMMMQMQMQQAQAAGKGEMVSTEENATSNPLTDASNQLNAVSASLNVRNGASPPDPASIESFLNGG